MVEHADAHFHRTFSSGFRRRDYREMRPLTSRPACAGLRKVVPRSFQALNGFDPRATN